jgi:hypothetical protein
MCRGPPSAASGIGIGIGDRYAYTAMPAITKISSAICPSSGGTKATITFGVTPAAVAMVMVQSCHDMHQVQ